MDLMGAEEQDWWIWFRASAGDEGPSQSLHALHWRRLINCVHVRAWSRRLRIKAWMVNKKDKEERDKERARHEDDMRQRAREQLLCAIKARSIEQAREFRHKQQRQEALALAHDARQPAEYVPPKRVPWGGKYPVEEAGAHAANLKSTAKGAHPWQVATAQPDITPQHGDRPVLSPRERWRKMHLYGAQVRSKRQALQGKSGVSTPASPDDALPGHMWPHADSLAHQAQPPPSTGPAPAGARASAPPLWGDASARGVSTSSAALASSSSPSPLSSAALPTEPLSSRHADSVGEESLPCLGEESPPSPPHAERDAAGALYVPSLSRLQPPPPFIGSPVRAGADRRRVDAEAGLTSPLKTGGETRAMRQTEGQRQESGGQAQAVPQVQHRHADMSQADMPRARRVALLPSKQAWLPQQQQHSSGVVDLLNPQPRERSARKAPARTHASDEPDEESQPVVESAAALRLRRMQALRDAAEELSDRVSHLAQQQRHARAQVAPPLPAPPRPRPRPRPLLLSRVLPPRQAAVALQARAAR